MARFHFALPFLVSLLAAALPADAQLVFTDITETAGVGQEGLLTESVAWGDYDNDGDEDLYYTNNGPNRLYRNDGDGSFSDVTAEAGVGHPGFSVGTAFGDLDNDGDLDLYVVSFGTGTDVLYRNDGPVGPGGVYVFTDVTLEAGTTLTASSRGMAFLDYDRDGWLDIYVNAIGEDILYRNLGDLTFENRATALGLENPGQGVGVVATDVDGNGWIDLFTGNRSGDLNRLFLNDGGTFVDATVASGILATGLGMGVLSLDWDNDLDFDLYWTTWPGAGIEPVANAFYDNLGFGDIATMGFEEIAADSLTTDPEGWGISCNAGDVDNDGWEDFVVTNGFSPDSAPNVLFHNQADGTFADATAALGGADFDGRGVALADFDLDGDLDLTLTGGPLAKTRLWRNDTPNDNHWLVVRVIATAGSPSAIGARIEVETNLGVQAKEVSGGAGRGSFNSLPVEFGLGLADTIERLTVRWPSGRIETFSDLAMDRYVTFREASLFRDGFEGGGTEAWAATIIEPDRRFEDQPMPPLPQPKPAF